MPRDAQYKIICRVEDLYEITHYLRSLGLHTTAHFSNVLERQIIVQLTDETRVYLLLKFPNIIIREAKFVNGKM